MVGGKQYEVTVHMKSPTVWIATGEYMGKTVSVKGQSEDTALTRWREVAVYRGN
jgi:hypothetical protein